MSFWHKTILCCFTLFVLRPASAHPVVIKAREHNALTYSLRNNLLAMSWQGTGFKRISMQNDEMEDESLLVFRSPTKEMKVREKLHHPKAKDPFKNKVTSYHRLVLDDRHFSKCEEAC